MTEEVRVSADGLYILVHSAGPPSLEEMKQSLARIAELRHDHDIDKILVDSRNRSGQPSVAVLFSGGEQLARTLGSGTRIAVLVDAITADHTFFKDVAVNRGGIVAFFQDEELALQWLSKTDP